MKWRLAPLIAVLACGVVFLLDAAPAQACGQKVVNGVYLPLDEGECAARAAAQAEAAANQAILDDLAAQGLTEGMDPMALEQAVRAGGVEEALALVETIQAAQAEAAANPGQTVNWSYEGENWAIGSSVTNPIQVEVTITAPPTTAPPLPTPTTAPEVPAATWNSSAEEIATHNDLYADNSQKVVNGVYLRFTDEEQAELDARRAEAAQEQEVRDATLAAVEVVAAENPGRQVCADLASGMPVCATATVPTTTIAAIASSPPPTTAAPIENDLSDDPDAYTGWSHGEIIAASPCGSQKVVNGTYMPLGFGECFQRELDQWRSNTAVEAQEAADAAARENPGVQQCASWTAGDRSGQACSIETRLAPGEGFLTEQVQQTDPEGNPIGDGEPVSCGTADWDNPLCYPDGLVPAKGGSVYRPDGDVVVPTEPPTGFLETGYQGVDEEGNPIETGEDAPAVCGPADWENPSCYENGVLPVNRWAWNPNPIAPPTTTTTTTTTTTVPPTTTTTTTTTVPPTTTTVPPTTTTVPPTTTTTAPETELFSATVAVDQGAISTRRNSSLAVAQQQAFSHLAAFSPRIVLSPQPDLADLEEEITADFARRGLQDSGLLEQALAEARTARPARILSPIVLSPQPDLAALSGLTGYRLFRQQEAFHRVSYFGGGNFNDGIPDSVDWDADNDGIPNSVDFDCDNDGIPNSVDFDDGGC